IDYGIHLMHRYEEERKKKNTLTKSIETAVVSTGMAVMATTATTVVGFLALVIAPLPMMANLGKVCGLGIFFCMVSVITLLPALIIIEEKYILPIIKKEKR
ncbi:MAG TPA: RND family transporter, partial [Methanothermococcus okinawensis]|nr:RND family transporter [Methanothermococcus okinawensis]